MLVFTAFKSDQLGPNYGHGRPPPPAKKHGKMLAIRISAPVGGSSVSGCQKRGGAAPKIADLGPKGTPRPIPTYTIGKLRHCSIIGKKFINLDQYLRH